MVCVVVGGGVVGVISIVLVVLVFVFVCLLGFCGCGVLKVIIIK